MPGSLSPQALDGVVRLGSRLAFGDAAEQLAFFWHLDVGEETMRRVTKGAGAAWVAIQEAETADLEATLPEPPPGPAVQQLSVDGAMAPLVGGAWAEVKIAAIGTVVVTPPAHPDEDAAVHTRDLAYFARMAEAPSFARGLGTEIHRCGVQTAGTVVAVNDGALWIQGVVDRYRRDAVRVLDFPHAVEHLALAAHETWDADSPLARAWLDTQAHTLKHLGPKPVREALRALPVGEAAAPQAAAAARAATLAYLDARLDQLRYPEFRARGYPIGSGAVESACKLVIEARLKRSGMRWARPSVNSMVSLQTVRASGRWDEAWPRIVDGLRHAPHARQRARWLARHPAPAPTPSPPSPPKPIHLSCAHRRMRQASPPQIVHGRPLPTHPWNRPVISRVR